MEIRSISSAAAMRVAAIVLGVIIALRFLWIAHAIFIVTFLGILLGLALARAADLLERVRIRRALGAPLVAMLGVALLIAGGAIIAPSVSTQSQQIAEELPKLVDTVQQWLSRTPVQHGGLSAQLAKEIRGSVRFLFPIVTTVFGAAAGIVLILFIAMYIGVEPGLYKEGMLHLIPHRVRSRGHEFLTTLAITLRQWLVARLMAMVLVGTLTGLALALLRVKGAMALGVMAGLLEFVPFFGPIVSAIPAIGVALLDSPQKALSVAALYLVMQQLEGNVITPLLLEKRLDIPPVLTIVAVSSLGVVFGVIGMLIAEPLLAAVLVATKMLYVNDVVGDDVKVGKKQ